MPTKLPASAVGVGVRAGLAARVADVRQILQNKSTIGRIDEARGMIISYDDSCKSYTCLICHLRLLLVGRCCKMIHQVAAAANCRKKETPVRLSSLSRCGWAQPGVC